MNIVNLHKLELDIFMLGMNFSFYAYTYRNREGDTGKKASPPWFHFVGSPADEHHFGGYLSGLYQDFFNNQTTNRLIFDDDSCLLRHLMHRRRGSTRGYFAVKK